MVVLTDFLLDSVIRITPACARVWSNDSPAFGETLPALYFIVCIAPLLGESRSVTRITQEGRLLFGFRNSNMSKRLLP